MPAQDRVRRDDRRHPSKEAASQWLSPRSQAHTLIVRQPQATPPELLLEHAVLLDQVLDRALLLAVVLFAPGGVVGLVTRRRT